MIAFWYGTDSEAAAQQAGAGTTDAVGASDGVATVTGVGASTAAAAGASAGTATVTGVGAAIAAGVGASDGTSTATGVGSSTAAAAGASDGVATVTGVGSSTAASAGASDSAATASGVGSSIAAGAGSSDGAATVTGTAGDGTSPGVGESAGSSTVIGRGDVLVDQSVTTTYPLIRDRQAYLIESATPASIAQVPFRREEGRIDFREWVARNPQAALRRFHIMGSMRIPGPLASSPTQEIRRTETIVTVAYPKSRGTYGGTVRDLSDVIYEDMDAIDHAIGHRGYVGNMPGQWLGRRVSGVQIDEAPAALFATATYQVEWRRSVQ